MNGMNIVDILYEALCSAAKSVLEANNKPADRGACEHMADHYFTQAVLKAAHHEEANHG